MIFDLEELFKSYKNQRIYLCKNAGVSIEKSHEKEGGLNQYSAMVNEFLVNCGDAEKETVSEQEWWIINGSVKVQIFLTTLEDNAELVVAANLFRYEQTDAELNQYVLQLNGTFKLKGVCFGIRNKHLVLSYIRPVQGLDPEELEWIIASIAVIADEYDDFLINKFRISY